jgi:hypothetical protein
MCIKNAFYPETAESAILASLQGPTAAQTIAQPSLAPPRSGQPVSRWGERKRPQPGIDIFLPKGRSGLILKRRVEQAEVTVRRSDARILQNTFIV